jgi:hypothetical protein
MIQHTQCQPSHHYHGTTIGQPHHRVRAGHRTIAASHRREDRPHNKPSEEPEHLTMTGPTI